MDAIDFKLELTNPSTIYEQEKINLWAEKVRLATDMKTLKMISNEWIYHNIFKLTEEEIKKQREDVVYDTFDLNRLTKIEMEGIDPYDEDSQQPQPGQEGEQPTEQPIEGEPVVKDKADTSAENGKEGGRPQMTGDNGTDDNAFGRDPLGKADVMRNFGRETRKERIASKLKHISDSEKMLRDSIRKKIQSKTLAKKGKHMLREDVDFEQNSDTGSLLDDKNILTDI